MARYSGFSFLIGSLPRSFEPPPWRERCIRMGGWWLGAALLLGLAIVFLPWDQTVSSALRGLSRREGLDWISELVRVLKVLGKGDVLVSIALVLGACGLRRQALQVVVAIVLVLALVWPVKVAVSRERPRGDSFVSFPSGDAASAAAAAVPIVVRFPWSAPLAAAAVASVAVGRVIDGAHYPSDVSGGIAFGLVAGSVAIMICRQRYIRLGSSAFLLLALGYGFIRWGFALIGGGNEFLEFVKVLAPALILAMAGRFLKIGSRRPGAESSTPGGAPGLLQRIYTSFTNRIEGDRRLEAALITAVVAIILALYLFSTTRSTLWDRDEPRFARATVEMTQSGNYLYPTFNGALRPDKPILIYWLMSLTVRLLGQTELACRFFAPLGTALACLLTFYTGRHLLRLRAAPSVLAAVIVATTPLMTVSGTAATTDGLLLFLITASLAVLVRMMERGVTWPSVLLAASVLGAAQLTKGPVGLAVVLLSFGLMMRLSQDSLGSRRSLYGAVALAVMVSFGLFAAWAIPANDATGGELYRLGIGHHVVERSMKPLESHGGSFLVSLPYYIPVLLAGFFPWTLFLPGAAVALFRGTLAPRKSRAVLIGWIVPTLILMSLVGTKLPHYILPIWPGLALALACLVEKSSEQGSLSTRDLAWMKRGLWLMAPVGALLGLLLVFVPWIVPLTGVRGGCVSLGLLLLAMTVLASRELRAARLGSAATVLALGMVLFHIVLSAALLPSLEKFKVSPAIAAEINKVVPRDVPVGAFKYDEPSLIFYLDRKLDVLGDEDAVAQWLLQPGARALIITREALEKIEARYGSRASLGLKELAQARGFNYSKGRWVELVALEKG